MTNLVNLTREAVVEVLQFSKAKASLSDVFDDVERGDARVVERRKSPRVAFLRVDEIDELLRRHYPFSTQVSRADDRTVTVWLNELAVYGRGATLADAAEDLLDEVEAYVEEWEESLRHAPNHRQRRWWVHRLQLAGDRDELRRVILDEGTATT